MTDLIFDPSSCSATSGGAVPPDFETAIPAWQFVPEYWARRWPLMARYTPDILYQDVPSWNHEQIHLNQRMHACAPWRVLRALPRVRLGPAQRPWGGTLPFIDHGYPLPAMQRVLHMVGFRHIEALTVMPVLYDNGLQHWHGSFAVDAFNSQWMVTMAMARDLWADCPLELFDYLLNPDQPDLTYHFCLQVQLLDLIADSRVLPSQQTDYMPHDHFAILYPPITSIDEPVHVPPESYLRVRRVGEALKPGPGDPDPEVQPDIYGPVLTPPALYHTLSHITPPTDVPVPRPQTPHRGVTVFSSAHADSPRWASRPRLGDRKVMDDMALAYTAHFDARLFDNDDRRVEIAALARSTRNLELQLKHMSPHDPTFSVVLAGLQKDQKCLQLMQRAVNEAHLRAKPHFRVTESLMRSCQAPAPLRPSQSQTSVSSTSSVTQSSSSAPPVAMLASDYMQQQVKRVEARIVPDATVAVLAAPHAPSPFLDEARGPQRGMTAMLVTVGQNNYVVKQEVLKYITGQIGKFVTQMVAGHMTPCDCREAVLQATRSALTHFQHECKYDPYTDLGRDYDAIYAVCAMREAERVNAQVARAYVPSSDLARACDDRFGVSPFDRDHDALFLDHFKTKPRFAEGVRNIGRAILKGAAGVAATMAFGYDVFTTAAARLANPLVMQPVKAKPFGQFLTQFTGRMLTTFGLTAFDEPGPAATTAEHIPSNYDAMADAILSQREPIVHANPFHQPPPVPNCPPLSAVTPTATLPQSQSATILIGGATKPPSSVLTPEGPSLSAQSSQAAVLPQPASTSTTQSSPASSVSSIPAPRLCREPGTRLRRPSDPVLRLADAFMDTGELRPPDTLLGWPDSVVRKPPSLRERARDTLHEWFRYVSSRARPFLRNAKFHAGRLSSAACRILNPEISLLHPMSRRWLWGPGSMPLLALGTTCAIVEIGCSLSAALLRLTWRTGLTLSLVSLGLHHVLKLIVLSLIEHRAPRLYSFPAASMLQEDSLDLP